MRANETVTPTVRGDVPVFVGRTDEAMLFKKHLDRYLREKFDGGNTFMGYTRSNLLVINGVSGVGKSGLARALRLWVEGGDGHPLEWRSLAPVDRAKATLALESNGAELTQLEYPLFRLRAQLGAAGVCCDAFDLGLALWWEEFHRGFPLHKSKSDPDTTLEINLVRRSMTSWDGETNSLQYLNLP